MNLLPSEEFISALHRQGPDDKKMVQRLVNVIQASDFPELSKRNLIKKYQGEGIFVMLAGHVRVFCSLHVDRNTNEEYLVLLDISDKHDW